MPGRSPYASAYAGSSAANQQNYQTIGGALPWNAGAGNLFQGLGGGPQAALASLGQNYAGAYNAALGMNQANYNNILQGYQQMTAAQQAAQGKVLKGYRDLQTQVLGGLEGAEASRMQDIADRYAASSGSALQNLVSAGLGNSTVRSSVQRGLDFDRAKSETELANQMALMRGNYRTQFGMAANDFRNQALQQNTNLGLNQLQWMNSVNAGYPDAGMYANLAQMYGAQLQADRDRSQLQDIYGQAGGPVPMGGPGPQLGYTPRPAPTYGSGGFNDGMPVQFFNPGGLYGGTGMTGSASIHNFTPSGGYGGGGGGGGNALGAVTGGLGFAGGGGSPYGDYPVTNESLAQVAPSMGLMATQGNFAGVLTNLAGLF